MKTYSGQLREESPDYQVDEKLLLLEREESPGSNSGKEGTVSNNDVLDRYGYGRYLHTVTFIYFMPPSTSYQRL